MAGYPRATDPMYTNVAGLNSLPPTEYDLALQQQQQQQQHGPGYDFQADLDMFTNTQFFDLDMGEVLDTNSAGSHDGEVVWSVNAPRYIRDRQASNFNNYNASTANTVPYAPPYSGTSSSPSAATTPSHLDSRQKSDASDIKMTTGVPSTLEEASRMAAEEDKRRRNTAASARFRVKKKQREQALEKNAKDMTDRVAWLENRVTTLEMENKLLKDLITEKSGSSGSVDIEGLKKRAEVQRKRELSAKEREEERQREIKTETAETAETADSE